ncbi:MAG: hypothetical protein H6Q67_108 [Firmicutes bacterium]|nr:hypothetical protein [Bacillota bacterium]
MEIENRPFLQAALLCEEVTTDEKGRHNIVHEFSQYTMGYSEPFTIFTIWRGDKDTADRQYKEKTEIVAPDGRVVAAGEIGPFSIEDNTYRQVNSTLLENIDFTQEGEYELKIVLTDSESTTPISTSSYPVTVV